MYAIVDIAGKQFSVREKDRLIVPRLKGNANDTVTLDRVLLVAGNGDAHIGTPLVPNASVEATILEHVKGDKILVFRKKRRKRFKVKRGHRQPWTRIEINALSLGDEPHEKTAAAEEAAPNEVASDAKNLAEAAPDEVTPDAENLAEAASDKVDPDAKDLAEVASDEVDPDAKDLDEAAPDEVDPDAKDLAEAASDEVTPDAKDLAEAASDEVTPDAKNLDEVAPDDAGENEAPEAEALSETAADAVEPEKEAAS